VHLEVLTEEFARRCKLILIARPPSTIAAFLQGPIDGRQEAAKERCTIGVCLITNRPLQPIFDKHQVDEIVIERPKLDHVWAVHEAHPNRAWLPSENTGECFAPLCEYNDYEVCPSWGGKFHLTCTHSQFPEYDTTPVARESTDAKINNCLHHLFPSECPVSISLVLRLSHISTVCLPNGPRRRTLKLALVVPGTVVYPFR
jgi:hypothetical protein